MPERALLLIALAVAGCAAGPNYEAPVLSPPAAFDNGNHPGSGKRAGYHSWNYQQSDGIDV